MVLVGEDVDSARRDLLALLKRKNEDAVAMTCLDAGGIEILVKSDLEFEAGGFLISKIKLAFQIGSFPGDREDVLFQGDVDLVAGNSGQSDCEVEAGIVCAGFEARSLRNGL